MRVIEDNFNESVFGDNIVILGSFDGIHCGHRTLIKEAQAMKARFKLSGGNDNINIMVCTFKKHPLAVINKDIAPKLIMDNVEKTELFEKLNIDILNYMDFNEDFMKISPEEFIKNLKHKYNVKGIVVGFNYRFGYKNLGDVELLKEYSSLYNYEVAAVEPVEINGEVVSSSSIRHYLQEGIIEKANDFLGRPFMMKGKVVKGRQIGRTINFPTLNLNYNRKYVVPQGGVYGTMVSIRGKIYKGITNIGYNPTVNGHKLSVETHVLNFSGNVYNQYVKVYFIEKIRDEKKFKDVMALKAQLEYDKNYILSKNYEPYIEKI